MTTVKVWLPDCQGRLTDATIAPREEWSEWAAKRAAKSESRAVVLIDGREYVVYPVIEPTRIYWKTI